MDILREGLTEEWQDPVRFSSKIPVVLIVSPWFGYVLPFSSMVPAIRTGLTPVLPCFVPHNELVLMLK